MSGRTERLLTAWQHFLETPLEVRLARHRHPGSEASLLAQFHMVAEDVPAYRSFLIAHGIAPGDIKTLADFQALPLMTKQNYINTFPLTQRCRGGSLAACDMLAMSSGSTGTPSVWPRTVTDELDIAFRFEQIFRVFRADRRSTLAVVCFAMGSWVGGMFTTACCRQLATKGYAVTVATPGNKKEEIFRIVQELGPGYEQIVLLGYPPYIKDVIDSGRDAGVNWARYRPKLIFAGEVFSEEWRDMLCANIGATEPANETASLYGSAEGGVLGNETPLSIRIRKFFASRPELARKVFGESRLPTLVQYDPLSRWFEVHDGSLVVSGDSGVPLIRYHIADKGGIITYKTMSEIVENGMHAGEYGAWELPFVYVFGRADFTVSYFGANVYPENISMGLEQARVRDWVSGKFVLQVIETTDRNKALSITVELLSGVSDDDTKRDTIAETVLSQLRRHNSEFANYVPTEYQRPRISLKSNGDPAWFPAGVKHRYTLKS